MIRTTVDFGIDLGTTNSAIAVFRGVNTEIIKNNYDHDTTRQRSGSTAERSCMWVPRPRTGARPIRAIPKPSSNCGWARPTSRLCSSDRTGR